MKIPYLQSGGRTYLNSDLDALRDQGVPEADILAAAASILCTLVDEIAERKRLALMTGGAGQILEYRQAVDEALAALAKPADASPEKFHMLAASISLDIDPSTGAPAADVVGVARAVLAAYDDWVVAGAAIREARLRGKAAIKAASSIENAQAAASGVSWPY